jgi:hypothetical protein
MNTISSEAIQKTEAYIKLGESDFKGLNNKMLQQMLLKRPSREAITHQMVLWRNGKELESILSKSQQLVLEELISLEIQQNNKLK